jgi:hypothetical protein
MMQQSQQLNLNEKSIKIQTLLGIFLCAFILSYRYSLMDQWDSDLIVPEMLYQDLIKGISWSGWNFSDVFFTFPDIPFYFTLRFIFQNPQLTLLSYSILINLLIFWWVKKVFHFSLNQILLMTFLSFSVMPYEFHVYMFPWYHAGTLVMGLYFSSYFLKSSHKSFHFMVIAMLWGGLVAGSDLFFGIWTLIPLGIVTLIQRFRKQIENDIFFKRIIVGLGVIGVTFLFYFYWPKWVGVEYQHRLPPHVFPLFKWENINEFIRYIINFREKLLFLPLIFLGIKKLSKFNEMIFLVISMVVTLLFVLGTNRWIAPYHCRYFLMFIPLILVPLTYYLSVELPQYITTLQRKIFVAFIMIFLLGSGVSRTIKYNHRTGMRPLTAAFKLSFPSVECLNKAFEIEQLKDQNGMGTFWPYKVLKGLSFDKNNWKMLQVTDDTHGVYTWLTNTNWFPKVDTFTYVVFETYQLEGMKENLKNKNPTVQIQKVYDCFEYTLFTTTPIKI